VTGQASRNKQIRPASGHQSRKTTHHLLALQMSSLVISVCACEANQSQLISPTFIERRPFIKYNEHVLQKSHNDCRELTYSNIGLSTG
jgi:hypothetical protein